MILMYHKVHPSSPTEWWVTVDDFYRQMWELQSRRVVYLDDYDLSDSENVVITFDGVYSNVLTYAAPILGMFRYPFELFVVGDLIGRENAFDAGEPGASFASASELCQLESFGGRLQWHTKTHPDLSTIGAEQLQRELAVPTDLLRERPHSFRWLAYPHGRFNHSTEQAASASFHGAVSCNQGDEEHSHGLNRVTVTNSTTFKRRRIACIIASYNYGAYLAEAIESVLRQTVHADEVLITDDCSSDNTQEIAEEFVRLHPTRIRYNRNAKNLGIVANFNHSVALTSSDYIVILGADNRLVSNYLEQCGAVFGNDSAVGVVYTDFYFFGPRARLMFEGYPVEWKGRVVDNQFFHVVVPNVRVADPRQLEARNFVHGSSMFSRRAFDAAGGYVEKTERPEDYDLFSRMISKGFYAIKCEQTALEYRQHSSDQANIQHMSHATLLHYIEKSRRLEAELRVLRSSLWRRLLYPAQLLTRDLGQLQRTVRREGLRAAMAKIRARVIR